MTEVGSIVSLVRFSRHALGAAARAARSLGLRAATPEETYGTHAPARRDVAAMRAQGRLGELEALHARAVETMDRLPDMGRLHVALVAWAHDAGPRTGAASPARVAPFAAEFARTPTPFWAGVYAHALHRSAMVVRGSGGLRAQRHRHTCAVLVQQARTVLDSVDAADDLAWWGARHALTQLDGTSSAEAAGVFEKLVSLDPGNLDAYYEAARHALPSGGGAGGADVERVAVRAREGCSPELGAGGYALTWWSLSDQGRYDAHGTGMDLDLAVRGFGDLMGRHGGVPLHNRFARTMAWAGSQQLVAELFASGLRSIDHRAWGGLHGADGVLRAARAHVAAQRNA